jgi:uncharacterized membrane protein
MPLHPAIVHLPIGVALVAPFVLAGLFVIGRRDPSARGPWWVGAGVLAAVAVGCIAAGTTGESDAERLLGDPALRAAIEAHDAAATRFTIAACLAAFVALVGGVLRAPRPRRARPHAGPRAARPRRRPQGRRARLGAHGPRRAARSRPRGVIRRVSRSPRCA